MKSLNFLFKKVFSDCNHLLHIRSDVCIGGKRSYSDIIVNLSGILNSPGADINTIMELA